MGSIKTEADAVYRDYETAGAPWSGPHSPVRREIRDLFEDVENLITNTIDVLWVIGQSNANANSESKATSPVLPTYVPGSSSFIALKYQSGALSAANDAFGATSDPAVGSAWPSFALKYWQITGRKICIVPTAVGSSATLAAADLGAGYWASGGTLYPTAHNTYNAATAALVAAGFHIGKQFVIDIQGETEAVGIDAVTPGVTAAAFKTAKQALYALIRGDLGIPTLPISISLVGTPSGGSTAAWVSIRAKQIEIVNEDPFTRVCFWDADTFAGRGLMQVGLHYKQAGYNELGRVAAETIASGNTSQGRTRLGAGPYENADNRWRGFFQIDDADVSFVTPRVFSTAGRVWFDASSGLSVAAKAGSVQDLAFYNPSGNGIAWVYTGTFNWTFTGGLQFATNRAFDALNWAYKDVNSGVTLVAKAGAAQDFALLNPAGSGIITVPTGTRTVALPGYTANTSMAFDANKVIISVTSAAAAVADADTFATNQGAGILKQTFTAVKAWINSFATLTIGTSITTPIYNASGALTFQSNGGTQAGAIDTSQRWVIGPATTTLSGTRLLVTNNSGAAPNPGFANTQQIVGADGAAGSLGLFAFQTGATQPGISYLKARGTAATPTAVSSGDRLGSNFAFGYATSGGAGYVTGAGAGFVIVATDNYTSTVAGARLDLQATPTGSATAAVGASVGAGFMVGTTTDPGAGNAVVTGSIQTGSFTVATLPAGVTGKIVFCSNCRVFNGAGTQEGAGVGTGGHVTYNSAAWKIAGTNITAVA